MAKKVVLVLMLSLPARPPPITAIIAREGQYHYLPTCLSAYPSGASVKVSLPLLATCSAGAVVHQSCSNPVSSLHRVVGEVHDDGASAG